MILPKANDNLDFTGEVFGCQKWGCRDEFGICRVGLSENKRKFGVVDCWNFL